MLVRSQEMGKYVQDGLFDARIKPARIGFWRPASTSSRYVSWSMGNRASNPYAGFWLVPETSRVRSVKDLQGKTIATELVSYVKKYLAQRKVKAKVEYSWGATEAKAGILVDAIVELTETGRSLKANQLRIVEDILSSTTRFIAK